MSRTGFLVTVDGRSVSIALSPAIALRDVEDYVMQLAALFPLNAPYYPDDSLRRLRVARATAWITRLRATPGAAVAGRQFISFAQLAMLADQDTLAQRLLDQRLAQLRPGGTDAVIHPGERSLALERSLTAAAAVDVMTGGGHDSARIARNFPAARAYAKQLHSIPITGYPARSDSTTVLYRQLYADLALLRACIIMHASADILARSEQVLTAVARFGRTERFKLLSQYYPYAGVAAILVAQPDGRTRLDSLNARLVALADPRSSEFPAAWSETQRESARQESRATLREEIASFALLGRQAPPVIAHAWINTPDSSYADTPRARDWRDGRIHVLAFGGGYQGNVVILERIKQQFPDGVEIVLVTNTDGFVGPDVKAPADEVRWLSDFYRNVRHLTIPIAIWAGAKRPGPLGTSRPEPPPFYAAYHLGALYGSCILVDGNGIVRSYEPIRNRDDEARLIDHLRQLRSVESARRTSVLPLASSGPTSDVPVAGGAPPLQ